MLLLMQSINLCSVSTIFVSILDNVCNNLSQIGSKVRRRTKSLAEKNDCQVDGGIKVP